MKTTKRTLFVALVATAATVSISLPALAEKSPAIIGGWEAPIATAPWQVGLLNPATPGDTQYDRQFCGGSILNANWIITAAHCVADFQGPHDTLAVFAGSNDLDVSPGTHEYGVEDFIVHPLYRPNERNYHDIALIKLADPLTLTPGVMEPIALPYALNSSIWPTQKSSVLVTGWGEQTHYGLGDYPTIMRATNLTVMAGPTSPKCGSYATTAWNPLYEVCVGYANGARDTCSGDSGGPYEMVADANGDGTTEPTLMGVTSWGEGCADAKYPGFATRVSAYLDWIVPEVTWLTVDPQGSFANLDWGIPETDQMLSTPGTSFLLQQSDNGGVTWSDVATYGWGRFSSAPDYIPGRQFRIAGINAVNDGDPSNLIWITSSGQSSHNAGVPAAPSKPKIKKMRGGVLLSWGAAKLKGGTANGGSVVWDYLVYQRRIGTQHSLGTTNWVQIDDGVSDSTSATISTVDTGRFQYAVVAVNNQGESAMSPPVTIKQ